MRLVGQTGRPARRGGARMTGQLVNGGELGSAGSAAITCIYYYYTEIMPFMLCNRLTRSTRLTIYHDLTSSENYSQSVTMQRRSLPSDRARRRTPSRRIHL